MVRYYDDPISTLWECHSARKRLWVFCCNCGHVTHVSPYSLITKTKSSEGEFVKLYQVAKRMRCRSCQHHAALLIPKTYPSYPQEGGSR
jgi:hypothetical protein